MTTKVTGIIYNVKLVYTLFSLKLKQEVRSPCPHKFATYTEGAEKNVYTF